MENRAYIGVVEAGRLRILIAEGDATGTLGVSTAPLRRTEDPGEAQALDLSAHEGLVVLIRGLDDGESIYEAVLIEVGTQLMTALARHAFEPGSHVGVGVPEG